MKVRVINFRVSEMVKKINDSKIISITMVYIIASKYDKR